VARVWSQTSEICGWQSGTVTDFSPSTLCPVSITPPVTHSATAASTHSVQWRDVERQTQQEVRTNNEFTLVKKKTPSDDVRTSFLWSSQCAVLIPFHAAYSSVPFTALPHNGLFNDAVNSSDNASSSDRVITKTEMTSMQKRSILIWDTIRAFPSTYWWTGSLQHQFWIRGLTYTQWGHSAATPTEKALKLH
jgi:hypothetical protein